MPVQCDMQLAQIYRPQPAAAADMAKFHAEDYIQFLQSVTPENKVQMLPFSADLMSLSSRFGNLACHACKSDNQRGAAGQDAGADAGLQCWRGLPCLQSDVPILSGAQVSFAASLCAFPSVAPHIFCAFSSMNMTERCWCCAVVLRRVHRGSSKAESWTGRCCH